MKDKESVSAKQLGALVGVDFSIIGRVEPPEPPIDFVVILIVDYPYIARVMRVLVAVGVIASPGEDTYSHTPKSLVYLKGEHTAVDSFKLL